MSSSFGAVRRRPIRLDNSRLSSLQQPLLAESEDSSPKSPHTNSIVYSPKTQAREVKKRYLENKAWQENVVNLVAQWMAWFGHIVKGAGSVLANIGGSVAGLLIVKSSSKFEFPVVELSPEQEENLRKLKSRIAVPFDGTKEEHQEALHALWTAAYPGKRLTALVSSQWKDMGWQGNDPSTDFRGGGFISLENLLHYAYKYPISFRRLLNKEEGKRAEWEYPFAVAGLNLTFMLTQLFDLRADVPNSLAGRKFLGMLGDDEKAFDEIYCVAFEMMDAQWLSMRASYMEFNAVLGTVRAQLEHAMSRDDVKSVSDLPGYPLLVRD